MDLSRGKLVLALVIICIASTAALYALITAVFADIHQVAAVAAIIVAVTGFAWFRKEASFSK